MLNGLDDVQILVAGNPAQHDITNFLPVIIEDEIISAPSRNERRKLKMPYKPNLDKSSVERNENPHREVRPLEIALEELLVAPINPLDARGPRP